MTGAQNFRERLAAHLREQARNGERYVTAKQLADEFGTNTKRVGVNLGLLADETGIVEQWSSGSTGATWEITIGQ
jgi:hypothetical protein